jgi:hypothetical protein
MITTPSPQSLLRILARKAMLRALWEDVVEWAEGALVDGLDTPSLRILAGLSTPVYPREV